MSVYNPRPRSTSDKVSNRRFRNTVRGSQCCNRGPTQVTFVGLNGCSVSEFGTRMVLTVSNATLQVAVNSVVQLGGSDEVLRSHARRIVARVHDNGTRGKAPIMGQFPSVTVGVVFDSVTRYLPITCGRTCPRPNPAIANCLRAIPENVDRLWKRSKSRRPSLLRIMTTTPLALASLRFTARVVADGVRPKNACHSAQFSRKCGDRYADGSGILPRDDGKNLNLYRLPAV